MNASCITAGSPTSASLQQLVVPRPVRGPKQLAVRVVKAGGNPVDWKMRRNPIWPLKTLPAISGYDFAGVVTEADAQSKYKPGDRVFGMLPTVSPKWGSFAEFLVADEEFLAIIPDGVSFTEAAAAPLAALTAFQALAKLGAVRANETILIHAGSGGVGSFLIQIAKKILKLRVFTTSTSADLCAGLGADVVIDYRKEDFAIREYDYVIDLMGGDYLLRGMPKTRKHYVSVLNDGWYDYFGNDNMIAVGELFSNVFFKLRHLVTLGKYPKYDLNIVKSDGEALQYLGELIKSGVIRVLLDQEFTGLDSGARKVHDRIQSGKAKGKVTLVVVPE